MIGTGSPNPYDFILNWMHSIGCATIHRVDMVDATTDGELFDYTNAHGNQRW